MLATACSGDDPAPETAPDGDYVAVYFVDGHGLVPEFHRIPAGGPVQGLIELLGDGPGDRTTDGITNFVPPDAFVDVSEREGREQLAIELSNSVWGMPPGERFAALAQIVYTVATLEEGKTVLLLDGTVPGEILDSSFEPVQQPVDRSTFAELEPWIQVASPVAGATVGTTVPVRLQLRDLQGRATVTLRSDGEVISEVQTTGEDSMTFDPSDASGELTLVIEMRDRSGARHRTAMPLQTATP